MVLLWKVLIKKIKKVLIRKASEFIASYYTVCYYGKSSSGRLLKPEEYRKRWDRNEVIKSHKFISNRVRKSSNQFGIRSKAMTIWTIPLLSNKRITL